MSLKKVGLILALSTALLAYWLYEPLYPEMENLGIMRFLVAVNKIAKAIGDTTEMLGIATCVEFRRGLAIFFHKNGPDPDSIEITNVKFGGVPVRIFRPLLKDANPKDKLPGLLYFHGGGWIFLNVDIYHSITTKIALETGYTVVSVDYRLAPEHKFPIPFEDCLTATEHLLRHGSDYDVDVNRIAVAGDSAGGNLAAAVALRLSEETNLPSLKAQVLIYPSVQGFDFRLPSMLTRGIPSYLDQRGTAYFWLMHVEGNTKNIEQFINNNHTSASLKNSIYADAIDHSLLPEEFQKSLSEKPMKDFGDEKLSKKLAPTLLNPYLCPLLAEQHDKLPPTFMITAEYDVLRDEGFLYAKRLDQAGVTVEHKHFKNSFHGFINLDGMSSQREFLTALNKFLRKTI